MSTPITIADPNATPSLAQDTRNVDVIFGDYVNTLSTGGATADGADVAPGAVGKDKVKDMIAKGEIIGAAAQIGLLHVLAFG